MSESRSTTPAPGYRTIVLILTLLAFAVRLYRLDAAEFWFDEAGSYFIAVKDYAAMLDYLRQAVSEHPPAYYVLLHLWMQWVGASEFALRYLSLIIGVLFVPLLYRFARREFGPAIAGGVALAAAFSPFIVVYSQEARMYSLLPLLSLLALEAFLAAIRSVRPRDWLSFGVVSCVGLATHYYFVLLFAGEALFLLTQRRTLSRRVFARWGALVGAIALLLVAWLAAAPGLSATLSASLFDPNLPPWYVRVERVMRDLLAPPLFGYDFDPPLRALVLLGWLPILVGWRAHLDSARSTQSRTLLFGLALGALVGIALLPQGITGRQAGVMLPAVLILLVLGLRELFQAGQRRGAIAFAFVVLLFALGLYEQTLLDKEDWGAALAQLARFEQAGDAIVLAKPTAWPTIAYYHRRADVPVDYLPAPDGELSEQQIAQFMQPILASHARVWLGETGGNTVDPRNLLGDWLARQAFAAQVDYARSVSFYLFVNGTAATPQADRVAFGPHIRLNAVETSGGPFKPGDSLLLNLHWLTDERLAGDDLVVMQLVDAHGAVWAERRLPPCGGQCLTSDWQANEAVDDREAFVIPPGTPPDNYRLMVSLFDPRLHGMLAVGGKTSLDLMAVPVLPDPNAAALPSEHPVAAHFESGLQLVGYAAAAQSVQAGMPWSVELTWRSDTRIGDDVSAVFQWLDQSGHLIAECEMPVGTAAHPPSTWQAGEVIRQDYRVPAPAQSGAAQVALLVRAPRTPVAPAGAVTTRAALYLPLVMVAPNPWPTVDRALLALVQVQQPEHLFIAPDLAHPLSVTLGDNARLVGYQTALSRGALDITLAWRALGATDSRRKVFVHLLNASEQVVAQHDGEPAGDLRPTSDWVAGEYIVDQHRVNLANVPPGDYRVEVGMYDLASGDRLPLFVRGVEQTGDRVILTTVHVP